MAPAVGRVSSPTFSPLISHFGREVAQRKGIGALPRVRATFRKLSGKISVSSKCHCSGNDEASKENFFGKKEWVHFVGVGGSGMSALAMLALKQGYEVSGSDIAWSSYMDPLEEAGASLHMGHSELNLRRNGVVSSFPDAVVVSSAIPPNNVEILAATSRGVPVYKRGPWLGKITEDYDLIAVSGTHGKSTTTSMLAYVLKVMGDNLTAVIGAQVPQFSGANFIYGNSPTFVLEADEYDACFLGLSPHIAIVTSVDWEHVDIYPDEEAVKTVFQKFLGKIRTGGHLILHGDRHDQRPGAYCLLNHPKESSDSSLDVDCISAQVSNKKYKVTTYGMSSYNNWQASSVSWNPHGGCDYKLYHEGQLVNEISLQVPGVHNVLNSLAVIASLSAIYGDGSQLYTSIDIAKSHLKNFKGVSRRFELIGEINGYHIFDDYAHHPNEVRAVLQAARQMHPTKKILAVFQPHTYSRLAAMKSEFASALTEADDVVITEVYASREQSSSWNISGKDLAMSVTIPQCRFIPSLDSVLEYLVDMVSNDPDHQMAILTLGAGDITKVGRKLFRVLQRNLP